MILSFFFFPEVSVLYSQLKRDVNTDALHNVSLNQINVIRAWG